MSVFGNHICGCYYTSSYYNRSYLPQVHLDSHTTITPLYFTTKLSQTFQNPSESQLPETRYTFPPYDGVAVTAFACTIGDKVIKGHVEQKEQARKTFDDAVSRGETAGLLESLPTGVFGVTLGNIPANASIQVDITYGGELKHDAQVDGLRYILPTAIAPRYGNYPGELLKSDSAIPKNLKITVDIDMAGSTIRKVQCPSDHSIVLDLGTLSTASESTFDMSKASVSLTHNTTELGSDFVLQILIDDIGSPKAILEKHSLSGRQALMATFVPRFNLKPIKPEIIFIADQSGSMSGAKNTALIAALKTFLKSLPAGVRFNICAFGSHHKFLWEKSVPYNQENFTHALRFVQGFGASYGGTELLRPVKAAFESHLHDIPLELVVLTDGEIYAESQLFDYVNSQIHDKKVDARCFVLGVGRDVSHTLVEGFARAGNGIAQFITDGEVMDFKVVRMLKAALYPHVKDYRLEVKYDETEDFEMVESVVPTQVVDASVPTNQPKTSISLFDQSVDLTDALDENPDRYAHLPDVAVPESIQAPNVIPALLPFNRTTVHLLLGQTNKTPKSVVLHGTCPDGPLTLEIPIKKIDNPNYTINTMAAKRVIQELEEGRGWLTTAQEGTEPIKVKHSSRFDELVEKEVVRLGIDYQVANKWCSFVAVEPNQKGKSTIEPRVRADIVQEFGAPDAMSDGPSYRHRKRSSPHDREHCFGRGRGGGGSRNRDRGRGGMALMAQSLPQFQQSQMMAAPQRMSAVPPQMMASVPCAAALPASRGFASVAPSYSHGGPSIASSGATLFKTSGMPSSVAPSLPDGAPSRSEDSLVIPTNDTLAAVRALVDLQSFDGHWDWDEALDTFFASAIVKMRHSGAQKDSMLATTLVLAWLKTSAAQYSDLWEMVADKSSEWLLTQENSEQIMSTAMSALTGHN
ncbi:hypothetical protein E4T49_06524 [Aureobasidium sp. EXF-10728]|nr:hypothetical protein E4T49_06524 [Aureobasidium sp. EXF-10728]